MAFARYQLNKTMNPQEPTRVQAKFIVCKATSWLTLYPVLAIDAQCASGICHPLDHITQSLA